MSHGIVLTIDSADLKNYKEPYNTFKGDFIHYEVLYYDLIEKYKSSMFIKIKQGDDIITIIRCYIALEHFKWNHKIKYPEIYDKKGIRLYIKKVKEKLKINNKIVDLFSVAERVIDPSKFNKRFEFDFREVNYCHGCRKGLKGINVHKNGCF